MLRIESYSSCMAAFEEFSSKCLPVSRRITARCIRQSPAALRLPVPAAERDRWASVQRTEHSLPRIVVMPGGRACARMADGEVGPGRVGDIHASASQAMGSSGLRLGGATTLAFSASHSASPPDGPSASPLQSSGDSQSPSSLKRVLQDRGPENEVQSEWFVLRMPFGYLRCPAHRAIVGLCSFGENNESLRNVSESVWTLTPNRAMQRTVQRRRFACRRPAADGDR